MAWQRNDDQYGVSRKVTRLARRTRLAAVGLDQLAKNYSARALTDGLLDPTELEDVLATPALVAELVRVGMWHPAGHDCVRCVQPPKGGVVIHDYLDYNPSRAQVEGQREAERVRKVSQRDKSRTTAGTPGGTPAGSDHPVPVPVPDPVPETKTDDRDTHKHVTKVDVRESDQDEYQFAAQEAEPLGIKSLQRIRAAFAPVIEAPLTWAETTDLARALLELSTKHVRHPDAYLERVCVNSPHEVSAAWETLPRPGRRTG